jgi:hypothetical protein
MKALCDSIVSKFTGNASLKAATPGGLHFSEAPQSKPMPFVVYDIISAMPDYTFTENYEGATVQFAIYSNTSDSAQVNDIFGKLIAVFDWCTLTLTGYTSIYMKRTFSHVEKNTDDPQIRYWQYIVQYELNINKTS